MEYKILGCYRPHIIKFLLLYSLKFVHYKALIYYTTLAFYLTFSICSWVQKSPHSRHKNTFSSSELTSFFIKQLYVINELVY